MNRKVSVVIEKDDFGYYAFCPELPGCHSQGDSFEKAMENIREALQLYLETLPKGETEQPVISFIRSLSLGLLWIALQV